MEKEDVNFLRMIVDKILFHAHPESFGWKSEFKACCTDDEIKALERIRKHLEAGFGK
jgi:hypothetical protein